MTTWRWYLYYSPSRRQALLMSETWGAVRRFPDWELIHHFSRDPSWDAGRAGDEACNWLHLQDCHPMATSHSGIWDLVMPKGPPHPSRGPFAGLRGGMSG